MLKTPKTATLPHSRRNFLGLAIQGSAVVAAVTLPVISAAQTKGQTSMQTATSEQRYKPPVHFGLGGVPLGNEFAVITEKDAYATLEAAWERGRPLLRHLAMVWPRPVRAPVRQLPPHQKPQRLCPLVQGGEAAKGVAAE
jgi:hypothetical protein